MMRNKEVKNCLHDDTGCGSTEGKTDRNNCSSALKLRFSSLALLLVAVFSLPLLCDAGITFSEEEYL
jgi:hypothetical protein